MQLQDGTLVGSGGMTHSNIVDALKATEYRGTYRMPYLLLPVTLAAEIQFVRWGHLK